MVKKELMALPELLATPSMMKAAAADTPVIEEHKYWWNNEKWYETTYRQPLYVRSAVQNGILKVAYFSVETMRLGGRKPIFELYVNKARDQFLTYCLTDGKWHTAKLDRLEWPSFVRYRSQVRVSAADQKRVRDYFGDTGSVYEVILRFQESVRLKQLLARQKRETDPWDEEMKQVPPLPKDWAAWVDKVGIPDQFMYYQYVRGGAKTGYCSYCKREVPIHKPHYNKVGCCPRCRHKVTYKSVGKVGFLMTRNRYVYLFQKAACGFVMREFIAWRRQCKGEYKFPKTNCHEFRRSFFSEDGRQISSYEWGIYKQREARWIKCSLFCPGYYYNPQVGRIYGKTMPQLVRGGLARTGLKEYLSYQKTVDPELYLAVYNQLPRIEQLAKAGLTGMVRECLGNWRKYSGIFENSASGSLKKALGLNGPEFKRLRSCNGTLKFLHWLQFENVTKKAIPDKVIGWMCRQNVMPEDLQFILGRMNVVQICNYMRRQMFIYHMNAREMLTTWKDYLNMAAGFHYNVSDEIVYRTAKLKKRHDELVKRSSDKNIAVRAGELLTKFPHIDDICQSLAAKYGYAGEKYTILAPTCVMDILVEGDALHHCIASSDRYLERMEKHESYLLFLRKTNDPGKAYYTMEVEPNGTVRQIRTEYDRQKSDIAAARKFLREWQAVIAKRLTQNDRRDAEKSRVLREEEFTQMRNDQIKIRNGDLAGRLLVDVLTADLLETAA